MCCFSCMVIFYVAVVVLLDCFFFKQKTAYEMRISDWSSDVCSSDLVQIAQKGRQVVDVPGPHQPFSRTARTEPDEVGQTAFFLYAAPERWKSGCAIDHAGTPRFALIASARPADRKSVVSGKSVSVRLDPGGRRFIKTKITIKH